MGHASVSRSQISIIVLSKYYHTLVIIIKLHAQLVLKEIKTCN